MNKRRERLSPVIEAERRKSGVLERRASSLVAECAQLGRDLKLARATDAEARIRAQARLEKLQAANLELYTARDNWRATALQWKGQRDAAWAHNREFRDTPVWRIAYQRLAARFGSAS